MGVWRSWIKSGPTHVCLSSWAARAPDGAEKVGHCLCKTTVCHLWKVLEVKGGPGDWRKANGTPWLQKMPKDSFCNSAKTSAKCGKWEGLTPDSDIREGLAGEQLCGKGLEVVGQELSVSPQCALAVLNQQHPTPKGRSMAHRSREGVISL